MGQIVDAVGLNGVLIQRAAAASSDAQILRGLQKGRSNGQAVHLRPQAVDHVHRRSLAYGARWTAFSAVAAQGFERDEHESAVAAPGVSVDVRYGGIGFDDVDQRLTREVHQRERGILRPLHLTHDHSCVLLREEAPGDFPDDETIQCNGEQEDDQDQSRIIKHPNQRVPID